MPLPVLLQSPAPSSEAPRQHRPQDFSDTAAVIAHDFNNLLTTILGSLSLALFNPQLDAGTQERLVTAKRAGLRAQALAQRLLTLATGSEEWPPRNELPAMPHAPVIPAETPKRMPRVLVLDDEEAICTLVVCALELLGYEVVETHDGLSAIARYTEAMLTGQRFDVVISDLTIPGGIGGEETVRRLREIDPSLKAIVSSGYASDPAVSNFREHGFSAIIKKPYEINALGRTVAEVLALPPQGAIDVGHESASCATA